MDQLSVLINRTAEVYIQFLLTNHNLERCPLSTYLLLFASFALTMMLTVAKLAICLMKTRLMLLHHAFEFAPSAHLVIYPIAPPPKPHVQLASDRLATIPQQANLFNATNLFQVLHYDCYFVTHPPPSSSSSSSSSSPTTTPTTPKPSYHFHHQQLPKALLSHIT